MLFAAFVATSLLTGCACPDKVDVRQIGDEQKTCAQLTQEIEQCSEAKKEVEGEKGFTGKNVAAVVFFWPALIATHMNVNDATKALDQRMNHLVGIYKNKGCSAATFPGK